MFHLAHSKPKLGQAPVVDACNPSYSGDRNQEIQFKVIPEQIVCETLSQKKTHYKKRAGGVAQV
jgi:hypothetical protein